MKKIIVFALWGTALKYINGAYRNIKLAKHWFPDYTCRFYVDADMDRAIIDKLKRAGAEVKLVMGHERSKRLWRLMVVADESVNVFLVRDVDSRIGKREHEAVRAWEKSNKIVHIMRDHKKHTAPIMGGMWGASRMEFVKLTDFIKKLDDYMDRIDNGYTPSQRLGHSVLGDQMFLKRRIYPKIKEYALVHTSTNKKEETDKSFPSDLPKEKEMHFVGQVYDLNNKPKFKP